LGFLSHAQPPTVMPVDRDGSPFHELDLEELWKGVSQLASHINRGVKGDPNWPAWLALKTLVALSFKHAL